MPEENIAGATYHNTDTGALESRLSALETMLSQYMNTTNARIDLIDAKDKNQI